MISAAAQSGPAEVPGRLNIVLSERARAELQQIATSSQRSMTEVIRMALALFKVAFDESKRGNKLAVVNAAGTPVKEIVMAGW